MDYKKYIVTTTINMPTEATMQFLEMRDWQMIIVGDLKTPHEEYLKLEKEYPNLYYISPEEQERKYKDLSDAIGWNKIMRRNIGFCHAYNVGAELIASIDDDNIPHVFVRELEAYINYLQTKTAETKSPNPKQTLYFWEFRENLIEGIRYYRELFMDHNLTDAIKDLEKLENKLVSG